jgi:hypothetical protein
MMLIRDMLASGSTHADLQKVRRTAQRLTWGAYADEDIEGIERYAATCRAVMSRLQPSAALAGPSAAVFYDLPLAGEVPSKVYVRNIVRGRYAEDIQVMSDGPASDLGGLRISSPEMTVLDCARELSSRDALIVADAALAAGLCSQSQLAALAYDCAGRKGARRMRWVAEHADPLAESPGETWTRLLVTTLGYDVTSQVRVSHRDREARLDFLVDGTLVALEFDGAINYQRRGVVKVIAQLLRDGDLQELGYQVLHLVWSQLLKPQQLDARLRYAGASPVRRPRPLPW